MNEFDDVIREAMGQIPGAFESQSAVPADYAPERLDEYLGRDDDITLLLPAAAEREDEPAAALDARDEIIAGLERSNSEAGFEALAFYISFHNRAEDGKWGIFYYDDAVRALAIKISRDLGIADSKKCYQLAVEIVRKHELFHFRFDLFALQQELTLKRPLYNKYQRSVYQKVLFTEECYEESLANASSVSGWSVYESLAGRLSERNFLNIEDFVEFSAFDEVQVAAMAARLSVRTHIDNFVRSFCKNSPPGYRDFDRELTHLRSGLGGQLLSGSIHRKLPNPQAEWVGRAGAFADRKHCPEYLLFSDGNVLPGVNRLTRRCGGAVWQFHRYDKDPWPSSPHGHNYATGEKLDLSGGWIYDRNRRPRRRCSKKELEEHRAWIQNRWPDPLLPPLVWTARTVSAR